MQQVRQPEPGSRQPLTWSFPRAMSGLFSTQAELRAAILSGILLGAGLVLHNLLDLPYAESLIWASLAIGMFYGGRPALKALRALTFDIDVLMVVGAGLAAYIGHPEEGALLLFLFVLAGALEDLAMQRTMREVSALHKLMPAEAMVLRGGEWVMAEAGTLAPGERVKVRPGERVPADARIESGESSMDQSAITGESMPRHVKPGDELFAGTINTDDPLEATVLRPVSESSLQKILDLITRAREQREPVQRLIDRLSQPYALSVLGLSFVSLLVLWLGFDIPIIGGEAEGDRRGALYTAITLLIVASPCALVIATPTATLAAIARAARGGVLFKGGQAIEQLARIAAVCFDKTGTLTFGRPRLYEVHPVAWSDGKQLLAIAAGLEADSTHPIAVAVREAASQRGIEPQAIDEIDHVVARGIGGKFGPSPVRLGSYTFAEPLIPVCFRNRVREVLAKIQERGHVAVVVARGDSTHPEGGEAAVLIMADAVRPGASELVHDLHTLRIRPVRMLTGDNRLTAERIATSLNLDAFDAELLPQDKLDIVAAMKNEAAGGVAFIGDGVNDAPALAASDVSLAIGSIGTAAALETADAVLLSDNLRTVPWAIRLARRTRWTVKANLVFALSVIAVMGLTTVAGPALGYDVPLSLGVLAHEGGTLLVVLNSLLLLRFPGLSRAVAAPRKSPAEAASPAAAPA